MRIEQRIGRIDRIGQSEEVILVINFVNHKTIDEDILDRLLHRIRIFESSIGSLEPILADTAPRALQAGFDFTLTREQREQKVHEALTAIEEQVAGLKDVADAASALLVANDVDVAGLEEDLVRTGRYVGQRELALLLDDWAQIDEGAGVRFSSEGKRIELVGNTAMATRVDELSRSQQRTRAETNEIAARLRSELPLPLILDQELARTGSGTLLTATNPLVMAAAAVPGHRQARFASLQITATDGDVRPGSYVAVLVKALGAARGRDEIWGCAVTEIGRTAGEQPVNALLAALAEGRLADGPAPQIDGLEELADRAMDELHMRFLDEQAARDRESRALKVAQRVTLEEQYRRRIKTIENRIATVRERGRQERMVELFRVQLRRAEENNTRLLAELESKREEEIRLEPLAACVLHISTDAGAA